MSDSVYIDVGGAGGTGVTWFHSNIIMSSPTNWVTRHSGITHEVMTTIPRDAYLNMNHHTGTNWDERYSGITHEVMTIHSETPRDTYVTIGKTYIDDKPDHYEDDCVKVYRNEEGRLIIQGKECEDKLTGIEIKDTDIEMNPDQEYGIRIDSPEEDITIYNNTFHSLKDWEKESGSTIEIASGTTFYQAIIPKQEDQNMQYLLSWQAIFVMIVVTIFTVKVIIPRLTLKNTVKTIVKVIYWPAKTLIKTVHKEWKAATKVPRKK